MTALMRFKENPGTEDKVMRCNFNIGATQLMDSDDNCKGAPSFQGFTLTINADSTDDAERLFAALSDRGQVQMPLTQTFFSPRFVMVPDQFGVSWMVLVAQEAYS